MDLLSQYGVYGLVIGILTFLIIGLFHPIVIKGEYYMGVRFWIVLMIAGIVFCILSLIVESNFWSIIFGVLCASSFWGILEVFEQRNRVLKGWFPMNPKRSNYYKKIRKEIEDGKRKA